MDTEKLDLFCGIYSDNKLLEKKSVIKVMLDLQSQTKDLQGMMFNLFFGSSTVNENNDIVIYDAINKLRYDRGAGVEYVNKWLKEFKIDIDDILENKFASNEIGKFINVIYSDFKGTAEEKRKAHLMQVEFLDFFLKLYADSILGPSSGVGSVYRNKTEWEPIKLEGIDVEYLNSFCKSIYDESLALKMCFNLNYKNNIKYLASKLEDEIRCNILNINYLKTEIYLDYVSKVLEKRQSVLISSDYLDRWITKYSLELRDFPFFSTDELDFILNKDYKGEHVSVEERQKVFQIQSDFYLYACMNESNKIIEFVNSLKTSPKIALEEISSKKYNAIVDPIFKSEDGLNTFNLILNELGIYDNNVKIKRGTQAKLEAIWSCPQSKNIIFKEFIDKKDYVEYLNKRFKVSYVTRSMSGGSIYHITIKNYINSL